MTNEKGTIIKSALKYLVKRQIEEGSVGFAVDNDPDHDCCWDDVLAWIEAQSCEDDFVKHKKEVLERIAKREREIDKYIKELEALEQQPSEDCVSRSELQKTMDSLPLFRFVNNDHEEADDYYNCESVDMVIRNLPSVKPQYTDEEIDKAQAVEQAYVEKMVELAVEETKRPKGKWIQTKDECDGVNFYDFSFECSKCGKEQSFKSNYCPNCGAEMGGEENA